MAATPYEPARGDRRATVGAARARPAGRRVQGRRAARLPVVAMVTALWAGIFSYGVIALLAAVSGLGSGGTPGGAVRFALAGWLLGHGVPLTTPADQITLAPLAVSALAGWRVARAGVQASRAVGGHRSRSVRPAATAALAVAVVYAGLGAIAATLARTPSLSISSIRAAVTLGCFGLVAAGAGALGGSRAVRVRMAQIPAVAIDGVRTGIAAALLALAAGAAASGAALAVRGAEAAEMLGSYRAGVLGQASITVLCLAYAPNLAVWGAAYLLGPGFAVGVGTAVSPGAVTLGPLPAVPVLAGLPSAPATGAWAWLLAVPLVAAMCAGALMQRRQARSGSAPAWGRLFVSALIAGPIAGVLTLLAAHASSGALGTGRLALMGPSGWRVCLFATVVVMAGAAIGAAASRALSSLRP